MRVLRDGLRLLSTGSPKPLFRIAVSKLGDHGAPYTMFPRLARHLNRAE